MGRGVPRLLGAMASIAIATAMIGAAGAAELVGTSWRAETIAGQAVAAGLETTLTFEAADRVAGRGGCNRYFGSVELAGDRITFGPLGATRMACGDAADEQEMRFFRALEGAERFSVDDQGRLLIHTRGTDQPSRFVRAEP